MDYTYMAGQLNGAYREVFEKTELYGVVKNVNADVQDDLMMNLFDLLLTAQNDGKPVEKIVGPDMERFCAEYYQNYNVRERLKYFPVSLYHMMRFIFLIELIDFFCLEGEVDLLYAQSDLTPYLGGFGLSLLFTMILDVFVRPMIFRTKIKPVFYYIGFLLIWAASIAICVWQTDGMMIPIPMFLILLISGLYTALYLVVRSVFRYRRFGSIRRQKSMAEAFDRIAKRNSMEQFLLDAMLTTYKRKNKRRRKKEKKELTPCEFTEKVRRDYQKEKNSWKGMLLCFAAIILCAIAITAYTSTFFDTILFSLVLFVVESPIYWYLVRSTQRTNRIRKEILDACDSEGISVIEYAMRKSHPEP